MHTVSLTRLLSRSLASPDACYLAHSALVLSLHAFTLLEHLLGRGTLEYGRPGKPAEPACRHHRFYPVILRTKCSGQISSPEVFFGLLLPVQIEVWLDSTRCLRPPVINPDYSALPGVSGSPGWCDTQSVVYSSIKSRNIAAHAYVPLTRLDINPIVINSLILHALAWPPVYTT